MAQTAVTGFSEPFVDTRPFYRQNYFRVVGRTATGPGNGTAESASGATVSRLDRLVDYHTGFYQNGVRHNTLLQPCQGLMVGRRYRSRW